MENLMKSKALKMVAASLLLGTSVAALAANACCGDLACCVQHLICCFQ
jgi:hypothetical protein